MSRLHRLPAAGPLDGDSLKPLLEDPGAKWDHPAFSYIRRGNILGASVRDERYRYTEWNGGAEGVELYDHRLDPREGRNMADAPGYAKQRKRLKKLLASGTYPG